MPASHRLRPPIPPAEASAATPLSGGPAGLRQAGVLQLANTLFGGLLAGFLAILLLRIVLFPAYGVGRGSSIFSAFIIVCACLLLLPRGRAIAGGGRAWQLQAAVVAIGGVFFLYALWSVGMAPYWAFGLFIGVFALLAGTLQARGRPQAARRAVVGGVLMVLAADVAIWFGPGGQGLDSSSLMRATCPALTLLLAWSIALSDAVNGVMPDVSRQRIARLAMLYPLGAIIVAGVFGRQWLDSAALPVPATHVPIGTLIGLIVLIGLDYLPRGRRWLPLVLVGFAVLWVFVASRQLPGHVHLLLPQAGLMLGLLIPAGQRRLQIGLWLLMLAPVALIPGGEPAPRVLFGLSGTLLLLLSMLLNERLAALAASRDATALPSPATLGDSAAGEALGRWVGLAVMLLVLGLGGVGIHLWQRNQETRQMAATLDEARHRLRGFLELLDRSEHLAHAVSTRGLSQRLDAPTFRQLAADLVVLAGPGIALQWAPGAVVRVSEPASVDGMEIGHDLLADPERRALVLAQIAARQARWSAPLKLRQGGSGLIYRIPVFQPGSSGAFVGLSIVLLRFPETLAPLFDGQEAYRFRLRVGQGLRLPVTLWESAGWQDGEASGTARIQFARHEDGRDRGRAVVEALRGGETALRDLQIELEAQPRQAVSPVGDQHAYQVLLVLAVLLGWGARLQAAGHLERQASSLHRGEVGRLQQLLSSSVAGVLVLDAAGQVVIHNERALAVFHLSPAQLAALQPWTNPVWANRGWRDLARSTLDDGQTRILDFRGEGSYGQPLDVRIVLSRIDFAGKPHLLFQGLDLSDVHAAQRESEALARERAVILDHTGIGLIKLVDRRIRWANPAVCALFGYTQEEFIDQDVRLIYPDQAVYESVGRTAYPVLAQGLPFTHERELCRRDGSTFWARLSGQQVDLGESDQGSIWVIEDISERKQAEELLREINDNLEGEVRLRTQELQLAQEFSESLIERMDSVFLLLNKAGRAVRFNALGRRLSGRSLEELAGLPAWEFLTPEADRPAAAAILARVIANRQPVYFEGNWVGRDGSVYNLGWNLSVTLDVDGELEYVMAVGHDVTQEKALAFELEVYRQNLESLVEQRTAELIRARDAAEVANEAKSRFLATMSHELRTPLNGILGMAQLLQGREVAPESRIESARTIVKSGHALLTLLNDILDFAKIEAGHIRLEPADFSPQHLMAEVAWLFAAPARNKQIELRVAWNGEAAAYRADHNRIRQMLTNYVSNALKFSENGVVEMTGRALTEGPGPIRLEFSVRDEGIGLSVEEQARLFQAFSQADEGISRKYGGTGLGLSIVRALAEAMGGEVGVDSAPGAGARFWFTVGVEPALGTHVPLTEPDEIWEVGPLHGRVLLVDDDETNCKVSGEFLNTLGLQWTAVGNGREAVEAWRAFGPFDVILMDLHMPVLDGFGAAAEIRAGEAESGLPAVPIVAMTADLLPASRERCLALNMPNFLPKPVSLRQLGALLEGLLPAVPAVAALPPDRDTLSRLRSLLDELAPMLENRRFQAVDIVQKMAALVEGTELAPVLAEMVAQARTMKFDPVKVQVRALRARLERYPG